MSKNQYNLLENTLNPIKINTFHENNKFNSNNTYKIYFNLSENPIKIIHIINKINT